MRERKRIPTHPGGILRRQYLDTLNLSVSDLSETLGVSRKTLSNIVNEHAPVTTLMALRLGRALKTTPELWLNLQQNHDLWQVAHHSNAWKQVHAIAV